MTDVQQWGGTDPQTDGAKRLSHDEIDRIIELRLNRVPIRVVAEEVGCSTNTVQRHWHAWLDDGAQERSANLERQRMEVLMRMQSAADMARRAAVRAGGDVRTQPDGSTVVVVAPDLDLQRRMLLAEMRALCDIARIGGYEAPRVLQLAPTVQPTEEEAEELLRSYFDETGRSMSNIIDVEPVDDADTS